jgi:hypothetical protein
MKHLKINIKKQDERLNEMVEKFKIDIQRLGINKMTIEN